MLNRCIFIGRTTAQPELRYSQDGKPRANFTLAVDRGYKDAQGNKQTDFIRIVLFSKLAETCATHLGKGRLVAVDGSLRIDNYEKDGRNRHSTSVVAENVRFFDWPKDKPQEDNFDKMFPPDEDPFA